jgi:hypothetical protein
MNDIENLVSQVMAEHDDQAPRAADLLRALAEAQEPSGLTRLSRRLAPARRLVPVGAAIAVAAVMLGSAWAGGLLHGTTHAGHRTTAGLPMSCPARYSGPAPWVPAGPAGIDGHARLAPLRTPASAVVCTYDPDLGHKNLAGHLKGHVLTGKRRLAGGLGALTGTLAWMPRLLPGQQVPCLTVLGPQTNYLIGLTYRGGGREWVSTTADASGCVTTSNGDFVTYAGASAAAAKAAAAGRWPEPGHVVSCAAGGRLGQGTAMVPAGSTSLTICTGQVVRTVTSGFDGLVTALNALPTRTSTWACSSRPFHATHYELEFGYPQGPAVQVRISPDCSPAIDNSSLQARTAKTVLPVIAALLRRS